MAVKSLYLASRVCSRNLESGLEVQNLDNESGVQTWNPDVVFKLELDLDPLGVVESRLGNLEL